MMYLYLDNKQVHAQSSTILLSLKRNHLINNTNIAIAWLILCGVIKQKLLLEFVYFRVFIFLFSNRIVFFYK